MKIKYVLVWFLIVAVTVWAVLYDVHSKKVHKPISNETITSTQLLTLDDLKIAFSNERFVLTDWMDKTYFKLNGLQPQMFKAFDGEYAFYVFNSENDRKKGRIDFNKQTARMKVVVSHIYEVKNVLVVEIKKPIRSGFRVNEIMAELNESPLKLGLHDVSNGINLQGIKLQRSGISNPYFQIDSGEEEGYKISGKEQLYMYAFNSEEEVDAGLKEIESRTAQVDLAFTPISYKVHNMLIIYLRYSPTQSLEKDIQYAIYGVEYSGPFTSTSLTYFPNVHNQHQLEIGKPQENMQLVKSIPFKEIEGVPASTVHLYADTGKSDYIYAFLEEGGQLYDVGKVSSKGLVGLSLVEVNNSHWTGEDKAEIQIVSPSPLNPMSEWMHILRYNPIAKNWEYFDFQGRPIERIDLDGDGKDELAGNNVIDVPPYVELHRWNAKEATFETAQIDMNVAVQLGIDREKFLTYSYLFQENSQWIIEFGTENRELYFMKYTNGLLENLELKDHRSRLAEQQGHQH